MDLYIGLCNLQLNAQWTALDLQIVPKMILGNGILAFLFLFLPFCLSFHLFFLLLTPFCLSFQSSCGSVRLLRHIHACPWSMQGVLLVHIRTALLRFRNPMLEPITACSCFICVLGFESWM